MKIEKINDISIKCTLTSLDLTSRNVNLRDMTYGSPAAKRLFSEMMQVAQDEFGFVPDNTPLMIEAVPLQSGSIQLIITKVEDPEELDTRFSKFTRGSGGSNEWLSQLASQILEGAQDLIKQLRGDNTSAPALTDGEEQEGGADQIRVYSFENLELVCDAAAAVGEAFTGANTLYKDEANHRYYLVLHADASGAESLSRASNLLSEYGVKINADSLNEAYYGEHFEVLVRENAIQKLGAL